MKHVLPLLGLIAALSIGTPAYSQYIFMDVNGDGACTAADALNSSVTAVDVWLNTNHGRLGGVATCVVNPAQPLDIFSYAILMHSSGSGTVTFNSWTNLMDQAHGISTNYAVLQAFATDGTDMSVGYGAPPGIKEPPGLYKLGTANITVTGSPVLQFAVGPPTDPNWVPFTGYGTSCDGTVFGNSMALGYDFQEACGADPGTPVESTTWGKIKQIYR